MEIYMLRRFLQKQIAGRASPARVGVGKKMADIRFAQSAKHCIANGVHQDIGIRMSFQTFGVRNLHPAQDEFAAFD